MDRPSRSNRLLRVDCQCTESAVAEADRAPQRRRGGAPDPDGRHRGGRLESDGGGVVPRADGHRTTGQQAGKGLEELVRAPPAVSAPLTCRAVLLLRSRAGPDAQLQSAGGEVGEGGDLPAGQTSGRRDGRKTADPMVIVRVTAAAAARVRVLSSRRWSPAHSESRPARSAWRADPATSRERRTAPPRPAARPPPGPPQPPHTDDVTSSSQAARPTGASPSPASPVPHVIQNAGHPPSQSAPPACRSGRRTPPSPPSRWSSHDHTRQRRVSERVGRQRRTAQRRTVRSPGRGCCPIARAGVASGVRTPRRQPWGRRQG